MEMYFLTFSFLISTFLISAFNIVTDYPWWFTFFCLLTGAAFSFILYYRERKFKDLSPWLIYLIAGSRFIAVSIITFLLLSPLTKTILKETEKPFIVIAQDNSQSLILNRDSSYLKNEYKKGLDKLIDDLSEKYNVKTYSFGEKITTGLNYKFNEKQTDIAMVFEEIETRYNNRNIGAVIITSDGLYNKGSNPVYSSSKLKAPVFTIALGDTLLKKDIILSKVLHNRVTYPGNSFPVEVSVEAKQLKGKSTMLTILKDKNTLYSKKIDFTGDNYSVTIPILLEAKDPGLHKYRIALSVLGEENIKTNNYQDIFIEVLDSREKILLLANAPHPDIAAIKQSLEASPQYQVESFLIENFTKSVLGYNLVIMHQLPSRENSSAKINAEIARANIPIWYIMGERTSLNLFNTLQVGLTITGSGSRMNETEAYIPNDFVLFTLSDELKKFLKDLPALYTPFGSYKMSNASAPFFNQRIRNINTQDPLMLFSSQAEKKVAVTCGEGLWKWRLRDFAEHNNHEIFNELVNKTIQYLSVKEDKSRFRVFAEKNFLENEQVEFQAEVYNESYELINEPDVTINIINLENKKFPYAFSKTSNAYSLNAGMLPVGEYRYEAKVKVGEKLLTKKGQFTISAIMAEAINTTADHRLLYTLAKKHEGEMVFPNELNKLSEMIINREDIKPVIYTEKKLNDLINLKWLFFLLLFLLSLEWFLRKRNGAY